MIEARLSRAQARNAIELAFSRADKPVKTDSPMALLRFGPHGDELFRSCGMDSDGCIELCFGRAAVECYGQSLNDLSSVRPDHVAAKHSVAGAVHY